MAEGARLESVYTATYRGFESPPHRHIRDESLYASTGSFLLYSPPGGMRTPDRGSTTGAASWTDREPASGLPRRGERSESIPPSPPYFKKSSYASTGFFFACGTHQGDENPRPGFDNWRSQLDRPRACERAAPQGRAKRVNPPLTAIFEMRACTQVRAFFFYILRWGDENPRPGFDNWRSQLDRPRACERAAPQGRAKRVNPPLTAIFEMRACTQVRAFFRLWHPPGG